GTCHIAHRHLSDFSARPGGNIFAHQSLCHHGAEHQSANPPEPIDRNFDCHKSLSRSLSSVKPNERRMLMRKPRPSTRILNKPVVVQFAFSVGRASARAGSSVASPHQTVPLTIHRPV